MDEKAAARAVKEANNLFTEYKKQHKDNNVSKCKELLDELKVLFTEFPTFLNPEATTPTRPQEIMLVRETMEHAVLQAATNKDVRDFQRHFEILRTYYNDFTDGPQSERRLLILGLHLLRLLATNETRAFHMELERIAVADQESMYIKDVIQLERYLMEGSYHKMLQARKKVPSDHYVPLMDMMLLTVRREVFQCAMSAYDRLSIDGACKLLMFENKEELLRFIEEEKESKDEEQTLGGWILKGDMFLFNHTEGAHTARKGALPFEQILTNNLNYAHELYRIV